MNADSSPDSRPAMVWCPFPDEESAILAANSLLDESLIACANMVPGLISLFSWDGERGGSRETGALLKTNAALLDSVVARLAELHPYRQPAVVGWLCDAATPDTSKWLGKLRP